jgi:ketosteroid isomerase-like protein
MNREQYLEYVDHFNNKRYDKVTSYYTPDITVEYFDNAYGPQFPARTLHGPKEFAANYKALHEHTREVLELGDFLDEGDLVFVELYTEFHTFKDIPGSGQQWKKGDITIMTNWVLYNLDENGKMKRIRIAHFRNSDPSTAKYKK